MDKSVLIPVALAVFVIGLAWWYGRKSPFFQKGGDRAQIRELIEMLGSGTLEPYLARRVFKAIIRKADSAHLDLLSEFGLQEKDLEKAVLRAIARWASEETLSLFREFVELKKRKVSLEDQIVEEGFSGLHELDLHSDHQITEEFFGLKFP